MKSMTGYGRGESAQNGFKITVELSSVNRKQSEISVTLPRELEVLEAQIRDVINRHISRGRLTARIILHRGEGRTPAQVRLNAPLARAYVRELKRMAKDLKLAGPLTLELVARAPGVMEMDDQVGDAEELWPGVEQALKPALENLLKMREREGANLAGDLAARIAIMRKTAVQVQKRAPDVQKRYRDLLVQRVQNAGVNAPGLDDERLLKEMVYFADRSDISEELARLQSHFQQFGDCLKSGEPVGRTLDFLTQEMNREINTIGSKANDSLISRAVVVLKTELEKFREQAQNIE